MTVKMNEVYNYANKVHSGALNRIQAIKDLRDMVGTRNLGLLAAKNIVDDCYDSAGPKNRATIVNVVTEELEAAGLLTPPTGDFDQEYPTVQEAKAHPQTDMEKLLMAISIQNTQLHRMVTAMNEHTQLLKDIVEALS